MAMRGINLVSAVTILVEVGDLSRFESPRQLMAYLDLVPSERSTGDSVKRGGASTIWSPLSTADEAKAPLPLVELAEARANIALDAPVFEPVPITASYSSSYW